MVKILLFENEENPYVFLEATLISYILLKVSALIL